MANRAQKAAVYRFRRDFVGAVIRSVKSGTVGSTRAVAAFAAALEKSMGDLSEVKTAHETVAAQMREAVQARYQETVEAKKRVPSYRAGQGRLPGALGDAISHPSLVEVTGRDIFYVDTQRMNKEAAHWQRLNYGAGPAATTRPATFPLRLDSALLGRLKLGGAPRPNVLLPKGFFLEGGKKVSPSSTYRGNSMHPFYPVGPPVFMETAGIQGRQFLDAGVETLARELPRQYDRLLNKWIDAGAAAGQAAARARLPY